MIKRIRPTQKHNNLRKLFSEATSAQPEFKEMLKNMADKYGCDFKLGNIKSKKSVIKTATIKQGIQSFDHVLDFCRGMLIVDDHQLGKIQKIANELHPGKNDQIKGIIDWISTPLSTGFRALYLYPQMSNGHIAEILVLPKSIESVSEETHKLREEMHAIRLRNRFEQKLDSEWSKEDIVLYNTLEGSIKKIHENVIPPQLKGFELSL